MFGFGIIEVLVLIALPVVAAVILIAIASGSLAGPRVRESGRVVAARVAGLLAGAAGAWWLVAGAAPFLALGRGAMLAPLALGIGILLGAILGETVARPQTVTGTRSASLAPRRIRDHLPRALSMAVASTLVGSLLLLLFTTLTASGDDMGRAGRSLARACSATVASARGPYPGSFYSVWLGGGLLIAALLALIAAHQVVRRPRGVAADEYGDDVLRRRSLAAVVAGLGVATCAPTIGIAATSALALAGHSCPAPGWGVVAAACVGLAALSAVVLVWSLLTLAVPGLGAATPRRTPDSVLSR